jgi:two-component system, NarL family, nitrate/nitrite response regulator NarL
MKKINLLLADDHQIVLDGLEAFLKTDARIGTIATAHSGDIVLQQLEQNASENPIDVAILDISMPPGMDGIETAKYIRRRFPNVKIILLTMVGDGHFILNALRMGIHGYVVKEKSKEVLLTAIETVFQEGKRYFSPDILARIPEIGGVDSSEPVQLTKREKEILCILTHEPGLTAQKIGDKIFIARATVERHIQNIKDKLDLRKNTELVRYAIENRLCNDKTK